jgi:hypothetical protein
MLIKIGSATKTSGTYFISFVEPKDKHKKTKQNN